MFSHSPRFPRRSPPLPYLPWLYFILFSASSVALAYSPMGPTAKLWTGLGGVLLPFGIAWACLPPRPSLSNKHFYLLETLVPPTRWVWALLLTLSILLRLYPLLTSNWPVPDDGLVAFPSLELSKRWQWVFFFTQSQHPPVFNWALALFFKFFPPSIFSMRFFIFLPALAAPLLSYFTARRFFSKSVSFLCFLFFALSFWPLCFSRFCLYASLLLDFELLTFWALGAFVNTDLSQKPFWFGSLLGFMTGFGFWVAIQWPLAAGMILCVVFFKLKGTLAGNRRIFLLGFAGCFLFLFIPYLAVFLAENHWEHMKWVLTREPGEIGLNRGMSILSNWTVLLWGSNFMKAYGPVWGGVLNPLETALFLLGILELIRHRGLSISRWLLAALFVFIAPGLLSTGLETFRNALVLPVLLALCALGTQFLLSTLPLHKRSFFLLAFFLVTAPLAEIHLFKTYDLLSGSPDSLSRSSGQSLGRAYEILGLAARREGPGLIFLDLQPHTENQTLSIAVHSFNAAQNPSLPSGDCRWAAIIGNANYKGFLARRFPKAKWYWLGEDSFWNQGGLVLGIFPVDPPDRALFLHWLEADRRFHQLTVQAYFDHNRSREEMIFDQLLTVETSTADDPFLESVFCEKVIFYRRNSWRPSQFLPWLQKATEKGYPLPHLLVAEGITLNSLGKVEEAGKAFEKATRAPLNLTNAAEYLVAVNSRKIRKLGVK